MTHQTYLNWSSGKDAALALYHLRQSGRYHVTHLLTAINTRNDQVSMHGIRRILLQQQIAATGLPYSTLELPEQPDMPTYEACMEQQVQQLKSAGFTHAAFGDLFLEDLRLYREQQLRHLGIEAVFPLWQKDPHQLILEMIDLGFKAIVVCADARKLPASFLGRQIDASFLRDLPPGIDPCGENGEFHTFCYDGPVFRQPVDFTIGETIFRTYPAPATDPDNDGFALPQPARAGFWFCDLLPVGTPVS